MPLPQNWQNIYSFLLGHGLSGNAAAGILGNIYGESGGNPESVGTGGNGLIGWTPPLSGAVTGNVSRDLAFQENALMQYIQRNGSVAAINAHAQSPSAAASYFIYNYERPANPAGDLPIRATVANDVAAAAGGANLMSATTTGLSLPGPGSFLGDFLNMLGLGSDLKDMLERGALIIGGALLLIIGIWRIDKKGDMNAKALLGQTQDAKKESLLETNRQAHGAEDEAKGTAQKAEQRISVAEEAA